MSDSAVQYSAPSSASPAGRASDAVVFVAGLWRRLLAAILDLIFLAPVLLFLIWLACRIAGVAFPSLVSLRIESLLEIFLQGQPLHYSLLAMAVVILLLYGFLFTATVGATPGLRLMRLQVINVYGQSPPEWWRIMIRSLGCLVSCIVLGLGVLWIGFDREKRGLHDWMAGTYVIRARTCDRA